MEGKLMVTVRLVCFAAVDDDDDFINIVTFMPTNPLTEAVWESYSSCKPLLTSSP